MIAAKLARRAFHAFEPLAAQAFFVPEVAEEFGSIGLQMAEGYFVARSAPLGTASPAAVVATFYSFNPRSIRRFLRPDLADPADALAARQRGAGKALRRMLPEDPGDLAPVLSWLRDLIAASPPEARPLFAGHADLEWPSERFEALWHGVNTMREFRGDGHLAVLLTHELTGLQAQVLQAGIKGIAKPEESFMVRGHGWKPEEYQAAAISLHERGLTGADGSISDAGRKMRGMIEQETDHLALGPFLAVGEERSEAMLDILEPLARHVLEAGGLPGPVVQEQVGTAAHM